MIRRNNFSFGDQVGTINKKPKHVFTRPSVKYALDSYYRKITSLFFTLDPKM